MINRNMLNNKENNKTKRESVQNFDKIDNSPPKMTKGKKRRNETFNLKNERIIKLVKT